MAFVKAGMLDDLPPGSAMQAEFGDLAIAICNVGDELHALEGICRHSGGPLGHGALHGHMLVCPWHAWEYDCRTGCNDFDEDIKLAKYPVKVEKGEILVDIA
jgi:nitrite reductase/ring-hydroxylating ferredoxin subunit